MVGDQFAARSFTFELSAELSTDLSRYLPATSRCLSNQTARFDPSPGSHFCTKDKKSGLLSQGAGKLGVNIELKVNLQTRFLSQRRGTTEFEIGFGYLRWQMTNNHSPNE
jgi:hypothetical protein